jgi:hypothetical protein
VGEAQPPRVIQSGPNNRVGKHNFYLKDILGEAAAAAARTDTSLANATGGSSGAEASSRHWSPPPAPSCWSSGCLLAAPAARCCELGAGYYAARTDKDKPATTSGNWKHSGSPSPLPSRPNLMSGINRRSPARVCCRAHFVSREGGVPGAV